MGTSLFKKVSNQIAGGGYYKKQSLLIIVNIFACADERPLLCFKSELIENDFSQLDIK